MTTRPSIAIIGMACVYPDANSPLDLWENVLAQRRAFRRIPTERLRLEDYYSSDPTAPDRIYITEAAVIQDYEFDRLHFRVAGSSYRSADMTHWLALDVAEQALADAGFSNGQGLPLDMTGVILGNTLTGEFTRANLMRLRWPYVRRVIEASFTEFGYTQHERLKLLTRLEEQYKAPFPPAGEESLAGALSNTIAGRICNYFDFKGSGYTIDGACSSSLLSVSTACAYLLSGDLDLALAGGVDLSIDPFELVGFAKAGALAFDEMHVFDAHSSGFWPGEGCGMVVLMREEDARAQGKRIYALIRGWGISSDGKGGMTRPEVDGQILALRRAYQRAGINPVRVPYFEGHGTGTNVGDATELQTLTRLRREADPDAGPAVIGSIKANIGHTKAAAGIAGLIKAVMALHSQVLPPTTGCETPHPLLEQENAALRMLKKGQPWPAGQPLYAGVSAMGFGGINTHIVLEGVGAPRAGLGAHEQRILSSAQDAELFLMCAPNPDALAQQINRLIDTAAGLSRAELADLAVSLARSLVAQAHRAAVIAANPVELAARLRALRDLLQAGETATWNPVQGLFLGHGQAAPRIGLLFPGQAAPVYLDGGALQRRFPSLDAVYQRASLPQHGQNAATEVAQPAIIAGSLAGIFALRALGIVGHLAIGHSLGELAAFYWAGGLSEDALQRTAAARGRIMEAYGDPNGAMVSLQCGPAEVEHFCDGADLEVACFNAPQQTILSGSAAAVDTALARARAEGRQAIRLPVSRAFHSNLMAVSVEHFDRHLASESFYPLHRRVISTITGQELAPQADLRALLLQQITAPVRFTQAVQQAQSAVDLWIEVGPGRILSGLLGEFEASPAITLDAGGPSITGLLQAVAGFFVLGGTPDLNALFLDRFTRPFDLQHTPTYFASPCELAPLNNSLESVTSLEESISPTLVAGRPAPSPAWAEVEPRGQIATAPRNRAEIEALVCQLIAQHAELPADAIHADDRLLSDLHLNSITVSQLVVEAAGMVQAPPPEAPLNFADATAAVIAQALHDLLVNGMSSQMDRKVQPPGVDTWVHAFHLELVEQPPVRHPTPAGPGDWRVFAPHEIPFVERLRQAFSQHAAGQGWVVCLPKALDESCLPALLEACQAALEAEQAARFVLVQSGGSAASAARTLHLESGQLNTCVIDVPYDHPQAIDWILAEALAAEGYQEVHYDAAGCRRVPVLQRMADQVENAQVMLGAEDVLLVTGGGKGITAEAALSIARQSGARLALFGRSLPQKDPGLAANLERFAASGVRFRYLSVDITDRTAMQQAVTEVETLFGPVTGVLHGAAKNEPKLLRMMTVTDFQAALCPKLDGLDNLLACIRPDRLRLFVTFGSIIARTGLPGEAAYGLANEWLVQRVHHLQREYPACRWLAIEWSVWSGIGMGERLSSVEKLSQMGVTPIPPDVGLDWLHRLLACHQTETPVIVTGRFGNPPTLQQDQPELPFWRFIEQPRAYYPGIELVIDTRLSLDTDPYLADHTFHGEHLFPAVFGLEAMAQVAMALTQETRPPVFEHVQFNFPIVVPEDHSMIIRIAALLRQPGEVSVVIRCESTAFQANHFEASCCFNSSAQASAPIDRAYSLSAELPALALDPASDLYGPLLFHTGRFRRTQSYHQLNAFECAAQIGAPLPEAWFGQFLPASLALSDPGRLDAAIHAIQACIPQARLLPVGIQRLTWLAPSGMGPWTVYAHEQAQEGDLFTYDVEVFGPEQQCIERWEKLQLKRVEPIQADCLAAPLYGPYLERRLREQGPEFQAARIKLAVDHRQFPTRTASDRIVQQLLGAPVVVRHRPDGKPEAGESTREKANGRMQITTAHAGRFTVAAAGDGPLGCDLEPVTARPSTIWAGLLGQEHFNLAGVIAQQAHEDIQQSATRVWTAIECLRKAGGIENGPLLYSSTKPDGCVLLRAGRFQLATFCVTFCGAVEPYIISILTSEMEDKEKGD